MLLRDCSRMSSQHVQGTSMSRLVVWSMSKILIQVCCVCVVIVGIDRKRVNIVILRIEVQECGSLTSCRPTF